MSGLRKIESITATEFRDTTLYLLAVECRWLIRETKDFSDSLPDEIPGMPTHKALGVRSEYEAVSRSLYTYENSIIECIGELNGYLKVLNQPYSGGDVLDLLIFKDSEADYKGFVLDFIHRHKRPERKPGTNERANLIQLLDSAYAVMREKENNLDIIT